MQSLYLVLYRLCWRPAVQLAGDGGAVDRTDWKSYILPLLFFKRICDVWDEEYKEALDTYGEDFADEQATEATDNLEKLVDEATKEKPNKKWYSVSIDGLITAAENVEKVGKPVINLSQKVLSLLTGGVIS